jgi:hypothetical protein
MASLDVQLALLKDVWSRMQNEINPRNRDQVTGSENILGYRTIHVHTSKFRHVAALKFKGVRYQEVLPWGNSVGCFLRPHSHARWLEIGMNGKSHASASPPLSAGRADPHLHGYRPPVIEHICAFSNMK